MSIVPNDDDTDYTFGGALPDDTNETTCVEVDFPLEEIPTTPELRVQIQKNVEMSKDTCVQASLILEELKRRSSNPPKE